MSAKLFTGGTNAKVNEARAADVDEEREARLTLPSNTARIFPHPVSLSFHP